MDKVVVAMSGGVDSSVVALLLKEQGYAVEGLFMKNWDDDDGTDMCSSARDLIAAAQVCDTLGISLHTVNFARQYRERVFTHFLSEYRSGRTPNPDVLCNREIKFHLFKDQAQRLGSQLIATGHYARLRKQEGEKETSLLTGTDQNKDQSYFLYALNQEQLRDVIFPIGGWHKAEVRDRARRAGFSNHDRPDSTGICFIGERHFQQFLERYLPRKPGPIVDLDGREIGTHPGTHYYTIGQRRGLGIGGCPDAEELPWYVVDKLTTKNRLIVAQGSDHPKLFHRSLHTGVPNWIAAPPDSFPMHCRAKIRHGGTAQDCTVRRLNGRQSLEVHFDHAQRAMSAGQSVVFYDRDVCLGGAVIDTVIH